LKHHPVTAGDLCKPVAAGLQNTYMMSAAWQRSSQCLFCVADCDRFNKYSLN
jgi:hypothetical protein